MSQANRITADVEIGANSARSRFAFGKNWQRFLGYLTEERITVARDSLSDMLQVSDLKSRTFLDVGSGSGLFSLAAMRLGAARVHSFDYDPQSVGCTEELKRRYFCEAANWSIEQGSILDPDYLCRLGKFDVVYSWGVLHHTGNMWQALKNVTALVAPGGKLFIAIYNDEGRRSKMWRAVKQLYCRNIIWRSLIIAVFGAFFVGKGLVKDIALGRNPFARYREYKATRGMSYFTDLLDWLGGYPFEVAKPDAVRDFFCSRGFEQMQLKAVTRGPGNNEFVFLKTDAGAYK